MQNCGRGLPPRLIFLLHNKTKGAIIFFVRTGKQVKLLYEPVAVRCLLKVSALPDAANRGLAIELLLEKAAEMHQVEIPD